MLTQLTYSSRATRSLTNVDLSSILSAARRNNALYGLTGAMCYANGTFLQCLEGDHLDVQRLYQKLLKDERHTQMSIVRVNKIAERRFSTWAMGFFSYENDIGKLFIKHTLMAEFSPFSMAAADVDEFFDEVLTFLSRPGGHAID